MRGEIACAIRPEVPQGVIEIGLELIDAFFAADLEASVIALGVAPTYAKRLDNGFRWLVDTSQA